MRKQPVAKQVKNHKEMLEFVLDSDYCQKYKQYLAKSYSRGTGLCKTIFIF